MLKSVWVLSLFMALAFTTVVFAQSSKEPIKNIEQNTSLTTRMSDAVYSYPVKPGTKEWEALETHDDMLRVTQIPKKVLRTMTTEALLESVLNYPLLMDRIVFNSKQQGFDSATGRFNGFAELRLRSDIGSTVLSKYEKMDVNITESMTIEEQGDLSFRLEFLETLLAQSFVLDNLSDVQTNELLIELIRKDELKEKNIQVYGFPGKESTAFALGRILVKLDPAFVLMYENEPSLTVFIKEGSPDDPDIVDWIIWEAKKRSNGLVSGFSGKFVTNNVYWAMVRTPKGSSVSVIGGKANYTTAQKTACNNSISKSYPQAVREADCSKVYNCHSYAWYNQSTSNIYWMSDPGDNTYWNDRSYVGSYSVGAANRKVSYDLGDHSAITIDAINFRSKWGEGPRMRHKYNYCPYDSSRLYYYELAR